MLPYQGDKLEELLKKLFTEDDASDDIEVLGNPIIPRNKRCCAYNYLDY